MRRASVGKVTEILPRSSLPSLRLSDPPPNCPLGLPCCALSPLHFKKNEAEMLGWPDAVMRFGESAYMDDEAAWVAWTQLFVEKTGGNCVLIVDQHKTRYNMLGLSILAHAGVGLLTLPAHTTQALQPLDVSVFRPMKAACEKIQRRTGRPARASSSSAQ